MKNNYENGFVVVSTIDLINNIDTEMIHDCSTREKVYKEANKTIQHQRSEEWYKIAANYAVRSKEVDIERVSIPPHCYFYVSCEEVLAMNYENVSSVIDENDEDKCNKLLEIILNNHFIGEWNAPSKISAEKEEYGKMLEDMIEIDTQFKNKRLSTGYEDVSFKERFIKVLEKIDLRHQKKADEKAESNIEEYKQKLLGNAYEKFKVFEQKYLCERSRFSAR